MNMIELRSARDVLDEELKDPEFREEWERTALARAVALWLVSYRAKHNLTQTELAERLGASQPQISRWESGESAPDFINLLRLADELGIELRIEIAPRSRGRGRFDARRRIPNRRLLRTTRTRGVVERVTTRRGSKLVVTTN